MWASIGKQVGKAVLVVVVEEGGRIIVKYIKKRWK